MASAFSKTAMRHRAALAAIACALACIGAQAQSPAPTANATTTSGLTEAKPGDAAFLRGMQAKSKRQGALASREFTEAAASGHTEAH